MYIKSLMKRFAAVAAAAVISLTIFGGVGINEQPLKNSAVISGSADDGDDYDKQLSDLESKKAELDKKIADAGSDISGQKKKLEAVNEKAKTIEKKITKLNDRTAKLEDEMAQLDSDMRDTQYQLEQAEDDIAVGIDEFKERLRAMYIAGNDSYSEVLINADNFYDVLMRVELVKRVAAHDNEVIDDLLEQKAKIEKYKAELDEQSAALKEKSADYASKQADLAKQQKELLDMQKEYGDSIEALSGDLSAYQSQADQLSAEYNKVSEAAKTTTTTTTAAPEDHKDSKDDSSGKDDSSKGETTKKDPSKPDKTTKDDDSKPDTTKATEEPKKTEPTQTEAPKTTTPKTTTPAPEPEPEPEPDPTPSNRDQQISTVVNYAKSMVGGRYVWGGSQFGATDCSGLVMLSYAQIGISLPHLASAQAGYGTSVSYSNIQPGDLVFYGGSSYSSIYHVAMYIGDGKIVHAESSATGIVISYYDSVARYNNVTCIKRLI